MAINFRRLLEAPLFICSPALGVDSERRGGQEVSERGEETEEMEGRSEKRKWGRQHQGTAGGRGGTREGEMGVSRNKRRDVCMTCR